MSFFGGLVSGGLGLCSLGGCKQEILERIEYLRSLLPLVSGIKYLKQRQRIEREIDCWNERIRFEEAEELLETWSR